MGYLEQTLDALRKPFGVMREELPKFMNEPQAEGFKGTLQALVPQDATDVGLMLATGPTSKILRKGGAALAGMGAAGDAEAAGVPYGAITQLKKLIAANEVPAGFMEAIKNVLRSTAKTGNEFATYSGDPRQRLMTSGMPDQVVTDPAIADMMNVARANNKQGVYAHSHPRQQNLAADPSLHDLQATNKLGELIVTPGSRNEFTYYKPNKAVNTPYYRANVEGQPFEDASGLLEYLRGFKQEPIAQDWAVRQGLVDFSNKGNELKSFGEFLDKTNPLQYLNMAERTGRVSTQHQSGKTLLPRTGQTVPTDQLIEDYYSKVLRNQF